MIDPGTAEAMRQLGFDAGLLETIVTWTIILTVATVVFAVPTVFLARRKRRSTMFWLAFALSIPALPLLWLFLLPALPKDEKPRRR